MLTKSFRDSLSSDGRVTLHNRWLAVAAALLMMFVGGVGEATGGNIFVTTTDQKISTTGGCSLQEAIYAANFDKNIAIDTFNADGTEHLIRTQCSPGSGDDTIVLPAAGVLQMANIVDDPNNPTGPTATPIIFTNITIEGFGAQLVWANPNRTARAFAITRTFEPITLSDGTTASGTGQLTIRNVYIKGFVAKGGDGGPGGGGGGMGAGGAIYNDSSILIVENSTFQSNGAVGGNGGSPTGAPGAIYSTGGGGGGIGGKGGSSSFRGPGGGGGGSRGNGADGDVSGGGGGGTVTGGHSDIGGLPCGGDGGGTGSDGGEAKCGGGGGGGGGIPTSTLGVVSGGEGGKGADDGGGGGGGFNPDSGVGRNGGDGGWGGGGGSCAMTGEFTANHGGNGGFGGGGGACVGGAGSGGTFEGVRGIFGGAGSDFDGGGGAALGGAIFNNFGEVIVRNSTFTDNFVFRGKAGGVDAANGADAGAAIYSFHGRLDLRNSTISGNSSTGALGGIVFDIPPPCEHGLGGFCAWAGPPGSGPDFNIQNTIVAHNGGDLSSPRECSVIDRGGYGISVAGSGNLIMQNDTGDSACPGVFTSDDPQLAVLQNNGGFTPTMAIPRSSPAWNAADSGLGADQRGQKRPQMGPSNDTGFDIGAFELCLFGPLDQPCVIDFGFTTVPFTIATSSAIGGTTAPSPGTYNAPVNSVMAITAIPNPNYCFVNWTGPVTIPTSPISTVVLQQTQSVRANFAQTVTSAVSTSVLNPSANHDLLSVGLSARTNCASAANVQVQVFGDEDDQTATDSKGTVFSPDATNITLGALKLRTERVDSGDGRVYLIVVRATDAAGNNGFSCNSVVVPHDSSAAALASVNNQAAAARAYCQANGGAPPHGYFVIGDGPLIGPKK